MVVPLLGEDVDVEFAILPDEPLDVNDSALIARGLLPKWVKEIYPHQWTAVKETVQAFRDGAELVIIDAPTGSGKTLIAELVRRLLDDKAMYICTDKSLQDQFLRDFPYAKVLKGRANYPTQRKPFPQWTAADCTKSKTSEDCEWCYEVHECGYEIAKQGALQSDIAVINTAYFLNEANYVGRISKRPLGIIDECDLLEREVMGFATYSLPEKLLKKLGLEPPKKGSHKRTIVMWLQQEWLTACKQYLTQLKGMKIDIQSSAGLQHGRDVGRVQKHIEATRAVIKQMNQDLDNEADAFVRDNKAGALVLKPVRVDRYATDYVWRHAKRWLAMSATVISAEEFVESSGFEGKWEVVRVPMTFPVENRLVKVAPIVEMKQSNKEEAWPKIAGAITRVCELHPKERVMIHTVSYELTTYLYNHLLRSGLERPLHTYRESARRDEALADFRADEAAIILAPSLDRGIDLKDEDCRVQIIVKVPFPNLGDPQINARLHSDGGQIWYSVQTIRTLVQMTGRAVRSADDWATTYILDKQFVSNVLKKNRALLPAWWKEALDVTFSVKELRQTNKKGK